ncbi:uroporphyrinogen-III synthase [Flagellimonas meishanensis]|uniref:uroporphyrinogen-III synthase n=1 Tax=Flagellimonas meishanensis TaxID=2873264 RepID=UPI001CA62216|nr:uroporphyrinogen-III synthase [[Muricauda] meishanensis]
MRTVLSTKILTSPQKELLLNSGLGLVEYDALRIDFVEAQIPMGYQNLIFTSKNAVKGFFNLTGDLNYFDYKVFCVGDKTAHILADNGLNVVKTAKNASELAHFIVKNYKNEQFLFLSGNQRREELPKALGKNNVRYKEVVLYETQLVPKRFARAFDGVLFFSPSGIRSYLLENCIENEMLFCIGSTTASEAKKYSDQIIVATKPTVENVLVQAIKHFKKYD